MMRLKKSNDKDQLAVFVTYAEGFGYRGVSGVFEK